MVVGQVARYMCTLPTTSHLNQHIVDSLMQLMYHTVRHEVVRKILSNQGPVRKYLRVSNYTLPIYNEWVYCNIVRQRCSEGSITMSIGNDCDS